MTSKRIARIAVFVVLIVLGGKLVIPLGYVPFTLQNFFVIAAGFILGGKDGAVACVAYVITGLVGMPVFSSGGGISYVVSPMFGYIAGFVFGAYVAGKSLYAFSTLSPLKMFASGAAGTMAIYFIGAIYQLIILMVINGFSFITAAVTLVNLPWLLVVDLVFVLLLCFIFPKITTMLKITEFEFERNPNTQTSQINKTNADYRR